jgi:NADH-quinone oxidoreductase subunit J
VMVMFLFVIAYVGPRLETPWAGGPSWQTFGAVLAAAAIFVEIIVVIGLKAGGKLSQTEPVNATFGSPGWIGRLFLTNHLLAFEITSIVLLVAAVGGVILGSHTQAASAGGKATGARPESPKLHSVEPGMTGDEHARA